MITQTVTVTEKGKQDIIIGRRGTYETETLVFDLSYLIETFGAGTAVLMVKRPTDSAAYPAITSQDGDELTWPISATDTSYKGHGEIEIFWYVGGGLAKSVIYSICILRDIAETTAETPEPYEDWIDELTDLGAETLVNAQSAQANADFLRNASASSETLEPGSEATVTLTEGLFAFGIPRGEVGGYSVETVIGATPTIAGVENVRYVCGTVTAISITPPESGVIDVMFKSGATPAVLTVPDAVVFPDWFDKTALEANRMYEINFEDGEFAAVMSWQM